MKYSIVNIVECGKSVGKGYFLSALRVKMYGIDVMRLDVLDSYESQVIRIREMGMCRE